MGERILKGALPTKALLRAPNIISVFLLNKPFRNISIKNLKKGKNTKRYTANKSTTKSNNYYFIVKKEYRNISKINLKTSNNTKKVRYQQKHYQKHQLLFRSFLKQTFQKYFNKKRREEY